MNSFSVPRTNTRRIAADGVDIFYREAGPMNAPVLLLLHGFPASSHQYRELIPRLAEKYRVIAPDFPGFGFTRVPEEREYVYTFDNLAATVTAFADALKLDEFVLYVFDYGAPVGFRLAMNKPARIAAILTQNGNAYEEGLGKGWLPIRAYWDDPTVENRERLRAALTLEGVRSQYIDGVPFPERVSPESYTLDAALMTRPGNAAIQLDLFLDYANNIKLYPKFQAYFRQEKPLLFAIWGKFDDFFVPAGAEAFKKDIPHARVELINAGHFALETDVDLVAEEVLTFLGEMGF